MLSKFSSLITFHLHSLLPPPHWQEALKGEQQEMVGELLNFLTSYAGKHPTKKMFL